MWECEILCGLGCEVKKWDMMDRASNKEVRRHNIYRQIYKRIYKKAWKLLAALLRLCTWEAYAVTGGPWAAL